MPFLNPLLLSGLLFLAVPVLLILFMNRRKLLIYWAAYEWMRNAVIKRQKKTRIDEILKLISKLLLLMAVVLMVSRPFVRLKGGRGNTLIIVDNSPSMGVAYQEGTRLDKAKQLLDGFMNASDNRMTMYSFDGRLEPVVTKYTDDRKLLSDGLKNIKLGGTCAGYTTFFEQLQTLPALKETKRICFVGDFQSFWFGDGEKITGEIRKLGSGYPMIWHQVDSRPDIQNCAVTKLGMTADGLLPGRECTFEAQVLNGSGQRAINRSLTFRVDGSDKSRVTINLEPHERRNIPFSIMFEEEGWHNVSAEIDADPFESDNAQYAAVHVPSTLRILAVVPTTGDAPYPYDAYISAAIQSLIEENKLDYKTISPLELPTAKLSSVDILLMVKVPLSEGLPYIARIRDFVERGGGLVAFLPSEDKMEASAFGVEATVIGKSSSVTRKGLKGSYLSFMDAPNLKPENIVFERSLLFPKVKEQDARLLIDEGAIAASLKVGRGRVALLGFLPYQGCGNIQVNPNFVQMVLRTLWETYNQHGMYSIVGKFDEIQIPWLDRDESYALFDDDNNRWSLSMDGLGEKTRLLVPPGLKFGFYSVRDDNNEKIRLGYGMDTSDSVLDPVSEKELDEPIKQGLVLSTGDKVQASTSRLDLFLPAVILLVCAIVFEAYAHFFRSTREE